MRILHRREQMSLRKTSLRSVLCGWMFPATVLTPGRRFGSHWFILAALLPGLFTPPGIRAQRASGEDATINPTWLIDCPVAGILPKTSGAMDVWLYPDGGVLAVASYGLLRNVNVGVSFGGTNVVGAGGITWNHLPGVSARWRVLEEKERLPALVLGFDSQGKDGWIPDWRQYVFKSPGLYVTLSKNYVFLGSVAFHGGINYSLERHDKDWDPNIFIGIEKSAGSIISVIGEYNFCFDNDRDAHGFWNGALNVGVRAATNIGFNVDLQFKNLLLSDFYIDKVIRELRVQYVRYL